MKLTKRILEAIDQGINFALDDFDEEPTHSTNYVDVVDNNINTLDSAFLNAIKQKDLNSLSPNTIRIINKNLEHYLSLIDMTMEEYHIIRYMHDNKLESYLDDQLKAKYEKNIALFTTIYRKVKSKEALQNLIKEAIKKYGPNCDLNWIDTSDITDMRMLFYDLDARVTKNDILATFAGDISKWDVSKVTNMEQMFCRCKDFNSDISNWDVSNVKNFSAMFWGASKFNQDLSKWNVSNGEIFDGMFLQAASFNQDLSKWNVSPTAETEYMFENCPINSKYKPKNISKQPQKGQNATNENQ